MPELFGGKHHHARDPAYDRNVTEHGSHPWLHIVDEIGVKARVYGWSRLARTALSAEDVLLADLISAFATIGHGARAFLFYTTKLRPM